MTGNQPGCDLAAIRTNVEDLTVALGQWGYRDDSKPQPEVRRAANTAIDAIDAMLQALHAIRARLITEVRASDDATAIRADKLLAGSADAATTAGGQASQGRPAPGKPKAGAP